MSRGSVVRAVMALIVAVASVALTVLQAGFPVVAGAIGVRVGVPGAGLELARAVIPILVSLLVAALSIRFGIRALRTNATVRGELARGGRLLTTTAWAAWVWLVVELFYRQIWLGWATVFGNLSVSLAWSTAAAALCVLGDRLIPWEKAPRGVQHLGLLVVLAVGVFTALSAWSHRDVVPRTALLPVTLLGLSLVISGVRRLESAPQGRVFAELALASTLLSAPLWSLFS